MNFPNPPPRGFTSCPWLQLGTTLGSGRLVVSCLEMNEYGRKIVSIVMHLVNVSVKLIMLRMENDVRKIQ